MPNKGPYIWRFELPDDWEPVGYWCVQVTIPGDQQYMDALSGALGALTVPKSFMRDDTRTGAATVAKTWEKALYLNPFIVTQDCNVVPSPPIPDQAAADDAAAAIFTVFVQHIVAELNDCAPAPGDCSGCVDTLMTELAPYGATDAVRGALSRLCADLNADPTGRANYETDCKYLDHFNALRTAIHDNPYDWLNQLSDQMFNWLNQTADGIMNDLDTIAGLMGFGVQGFINDHGGIPSGGGATFGGDCPWEVDFDFTLGQAGWTLYDDGVHVNGQYVAGVGFHDAYDVLTNSRRLYMIAEYPMDLTGIDVTYDIDTDASGSGIDVREWNGPPFASTVIASGYEGLTPNTTYTNRVFTCGLVSGCQTMLVDQNLQNSLVVHHITLRGIGFNPFA